LGAEQSGFIAEIGFEMYHKILDEAIQELKEDEFKNLFSDDKPRPFISFTHVDTDLEVMIPDEYVTNIAERYNLYTELSNIETEIELDAFRQRLADRFGPVPKQVIELINTWRLQYLGKMIGFEKISFKKGVLRGYFIANKQSAYFETAQFGRVFEFLQAHPKISNLKEVKNTLRLGIEHVSTLDIAIELLQELVLEPVKN
jgi:transcription-repair coupling factor (superfamily II helicase)